MKPLTTAAAVLIAGWLAAGSAAAEEATGELAAIARDAYIFTFPLYENYRVRYLSHFSPANPRRVPLNRFTHQRVLSDDTSRAVTTPNNDTLYSSSFLDLAPGPLVLTVPAVNGRYYSLALMDFYANDFAYLGTRTTGNGAGTFLIAGPGWRGTPPAGIRVITAPTNAVWLLGRFLVADSADLPRVHAEQDALRLAPLDGAEAASPEPGPRPIPGDPWNYFAVADIALTENPPTAADAPIAARIATIGLGPGRHFDAARFDDDGRRAVLAGVAEAQRRIAEKPVGGSVVNGWAYSAPANGRFGTDYLLRAAVALKSLGTLEPEEAVYLSYVGAALDGAHHYRLHFAAGELPPAAAFWSLSAYRVNSDRRLYFGDNPIRRFSIGDRTKGLVANPDGSLDLLIQHDMPDAAAASNWLPAPEGPIALVLRAYMPGESLVEAHYAPPPIEQRPP